MKHQYRSKKITHAIISRSRHFLILSCLVAIGSFLIANGTFSTTPTANAKSVTEYCNDLLKEKGRTDDPAKSACREGAGGQADCNDFTTLYDQSVADICTAAASGREGVTPDTNTNTGGNSSNEDSEEDSETDSSPDENSLFEKLQGIIQDQNKTLSDFTDMLHETGEDSEEELDEIPDNNKGYYINGAGKQQKIETLKEGTGDSPVILFFNGGGWHANDHAGQNVAGVNDQGDMYDNTGAERAGDRGYAMYDVTYRLGSSGVYYMFEDVMRGIKHMRENADLYGIDPEKMVIWGDSAGGSLAMRAVASGKSGAKVGVGWSAITNAYTAFFLSLPAFAIGIDHSTCAPTDLAGLANFSDLLNGGDGNVAEYGQGLSSNDFSSLGIGLPDGGAGSSLSFSGSNIDPFALLTQMMIAGRNAATAGSNFEAISSQIKSNGLGSLTGSAFNLASKKFGECIDNFNALSPALFASPDTPPSFLAEFEDDTTVGPDQAYGMRDKLRQLGIKSEAKILPGSEDCRRTAPDTMGVGCHLGYYKDFVCDTLNFVDSVIQPDRGIKNCATGVVENAGTPATETGGSTTETAAETNKDKACKNYNGSLLSSCEDGYDGLECSGSSAAKAACEAGTKAGEKDGLANTAEKCSNIGDMASFTGCLGSLGSLANGSDSGSGNSGSGSSNSALNGSSCGTGTDLTSMLLSCLGSLGKTGSNNKDDEDLTSACNDIGTIEGIAKCAEYGSSSSDPAIKDKCTDISDATGLLGCINVARAKTNSTASKCTGRSDDDILECISSNSYGNTNYNLSSIFEEGLKLAGTLQGNK